MKRVLLFGDYSRAHSTLAEGLVKLGIDAKVASHGDGWKQYDRDIDISIRGNMDKIKLLYKLFFPSDLSGYDVIQFISPFLFSNYFPITLANQLIKRNKKVFLGAFGDDYFWVKGCLDNLFEISFLSMYQGTLKQEQCCHANNSLLYLTDKKRELNNFIAKNSDGIIACMQDYYLPYSLSEYKDKLAFIPLPINTDKIECKDNICRGKVKFFIGVQKQRADWKGLDIIIPILQNYKNKYPNDIELIFVENSPYHEYVSLMEASNIVVDQLYSNGQGMNGLTAMAQGKILFSSAGDKQYELLNEFENRPIISIKPDQADIISQLEYIMDNRNNFMEMGSNSRKFIEKHHHYIKIAESYKNIWGI